MQRTPSIRITLGQPLSDVRLGPPPAAAAAEAEKAAYERGRAEAEKALREQMMTQRAELSAIQQGALKSLREAVGQVVTQTESHLVDLAVEVASKLVAGLPISRDSIAAAVREALDQIDSTTEITVQLNPEDLSLFEQIPAPDRPGSTLLDRVELAASPAVERGGCVVHTRFGVIDNQPSTKLRAVRDALQS